MIFEVPWDSNWGPEGPISAPGGDRILPKVDFSNLRYEITCCTGGFFGQFFASQMGFQTCVLCNSLLWDSFVFGTKKVPTHLCVPV